MVLVMIWHDWRLALDERIGSEALASEARRAATETIPINIKLKSSKNYPAKDSDALNYNRCWQLAFLVSIIKD
jgi:hypothetical protein